MRNRPVGKRCGWLLSLVLAPLAAIADFTSAFAGPGSAATTQGYLAQGYLAQEYLAQEYRAHEHGATLERDAPTPLGRGLQSRRSLEQLQIPCHLAQEYVLQAALTGHPAAIEQTERFQQRALPITEHRRWTPGQMQAGLGNYSNDIRVARRLVCAAARHREIRQDSEWSTSATNWKDPERQGSLTG